MSGDELGTLIIVVLKARNLIDKHSFYKQDVYSQLAINGTTKKTEVDVKGGQHPVWDAEIRFPVMKVTADKYRKLELSCWSKEPRTDELLGQAKIDISETLKTGEFDGWVLLDIDGVQRGEVYLEITYYSNAPPPQTAPVKGPTRTPVAATLAPSGGGPLNRRPSKFPAADRLARPASYYQVPAALKPSVPGNRVSPLRDQNLPTPSAESRPPSHSPKGRDSALPSLPEEKVGRHSKVPSQPQIVPSSLRPGNVSAPNSRPPSDHLHPSSPPPTHTNFGYTVPTANPYGSVTRSPSSLPAADQFHPTSPPPSVYPPSTPTPYGNTLDAASRHPPPGPYSGSSLHVPPNLPTPPKQHNPLWSDSEALTGLVSFPLPNVGPPAPPSQTPANYEYNAHSAYPGAHNGYLPAQPTYCPQSANERSGLLDPYLIARYQSPLPLPPDAQNSKPMPLPPSPAPARSSPPSSTPGPDSSRLEALRAAEAEAARRKEQEEKDLELARQLDLELNLAP
ncbi:hypothetical protein DFS33DRAFT_684255 [Desarmillaria ectypa]|nr:hypothetical protein DFS33DRAFT_684255 [Desarmillaria ectypa]